MSSTGEYKEGDHLFQWFRSRKMEYVRIFIENASLHEFMDKIGNIAAMQITDLNWNQTAIERHYVDYIRRCEEMERQLRYFDNELVKFHVTPDESVDMDTFLESLKQSANSSALYFNNLESTLEQREKDLKQFNEYNSTLTKQYNEKVELLYVLDTCQKYSQDEDNRYSDVNGQLSDSPDLEGGLDPSIRVDHIAGVINNNDQLRFERMLFRATRGNCLVHMSPIQQVLIDPDSGEEVHKSVFIIFYRSHAIELKVNRIIEAFNAHSYPIPNIQNQIAIENAIKSVTKDLEDSENILKHNMENCESLIENIAKYIIPWKWTVKREKAIYAAMNKCAPVAGGMCKCEGWILQELRPEVEKIIHSIAFSIEGHIEDVPQPWPKPPTYMKSNPFTKIVQSVVNTYGVPRYLEINPAVFTLITFPAQFGIMFGDFGHAIMFTLVAIYLIANQKSLMKNGLNEMLQLIFQGRNMLITMGICAIFCGLVYNDCFGLSIDFFGTQFAIQNNTAEWTGKTYPFGIDPLWRDATNELTFINSYKMKQAIVFGVIQMVFGLILQFINNFYFHEWLDLIANSIPEFLFMICLFGYMVFLIIYKWLVNWDYMMSLHKTPPQLITTMINMALSPGNVTDPMFDAQPKVQLILILIAVLCVPWMLLFKPIYFLIHKCFHKNKVLPTQEMNEEMMNNPTLPKNDPEPDSFGQVFIFSAIDTIEFCLGCISHTASFLRLWALSLAHSQLAAVFWQKIMLSLLPSGNFIAIAVAYAFFMLVTMFVLLVMDALECYLHALRLHWVEFQDKFYHADGYAFAPLDIKKLLTKKSKEN